MRDDAQRSTVPRPLYNPNPGPRKRVLDARLTRAAAITARRLRPVAADWRADEFGTIVYAAALVDLKRTLQHEAFAALQRHYHMHRDAFHARLRPRAH